MNKNKLIGLVSGVAILLVSVVTVVRAEKTINCAWGEDPEKVWVEEGNGSVSYDGGPVVSKLWVKDKEGACKLIESNGREVCYITTGLGMDSVTVTAIELGECKGIERVEFVMNEAWEPTPTIDCCRPSKTPTPTSSEEVTPTLTVTATPSSETRPTSTNTPVPTNTPGDNNDNNDDGDDNNNDNHDDGGSDPAPTVTPVPDQVTSPVGGGEEDIKGVWENYNPLVDGIRQAFGGFIMGVNSQMPNTAVNFWTREELPSGNKKLDKKIRIKSIGVDEFLYQAEKIGNDSIIGYGEVVEDEINGNKILAGHNYGGAFEKLWTIRVGAEVEVEEEDWQVAEKTWVEKDDLEVLENNETENMFLVTCCWTNPNLRIVVKLEKV